MKFFTLSVLCAMLCFLFVNDRITQSSQSAAQIRRERNDPELAAEIKGRTNRTTRGLRELRSARGGTAIDLQGRFQNVMLGKLADDGEPVAACVTDLAEANNFFRRNLETGQSIASRNFFENQQEIDARRHGMTVEEFNFYSRLASEYASSSIAASPGTATFNIVNGDAAGEGFNDAAAAFAVGEGGNNGTTRGEQRLNVFNAAAQVWASFLDSTVPTNVSAQFNSISPCSSSGGVLGSAGTFNVHRNFANAEFTNTWYHAALANKRAGTDLNTTNAEIRAQFNTDVDSSCLGGSTRFYYGLDNATPSQRINLFVVVLHEIGHGVGFSSFVDGTTGTFLGNPASPDIYSRYMFDITTNKHWYQMTDAERLASSTNNNNVYWDGPSVRLASGNLTSGFQAGTGRVALFTPNPYQGGSSVSHFSTAAFPNLLMEPSITSGLPINLDLARQLMRDIGWYRDTTGDLVADTITNVSPTGSSIAQGQAATITWTNNGGFNRNVTIELSTDGGTTFTAIATDVVNAGTYPWTVPNAPTTQARIRVREAGFASPSGVSSANFTIGAQPAAAANIAGRVLSLSGRPISGARIVFTSTGGQSYATRSNPLGYFRATGLTTGNYIVTVTAKGRVFNPVNVNLNGNISALELRSVN